MSIRALIVIVSFWVSCWAFFCGLFAVTARADDLSPPQFDADLLYAQSRAFWNTIHDIDSAQGNIDQINQVLHDNYGTYEAAFSRLGARETGVPSSLDVSVLRTLYFGLSGNLMAFGEVQNPVVPQLIADAVLTGELESGFEGSIDPLELKTRFGAHVGWGYEKRVNAVSTDLIQSIPTQNGHVTLYGLDAGFERDFSLDDQWKWTLNGLASETFYYSTIDGATTSYQDWKIRSELSFENIGIEAILGPQPIPVDLLPRTWEYVDQLNPFPELGAMAGAGLAWHQDLGIASLEARAGVYAGYPGGQIAGKVGDFHLSLESWGIEASSAYNTLGQQIWIARMGVSL